MSILTVVSLEREERRDFRTLDNHDNMPQHFPSDPRIKLGIPRHSSTKATSSPCETSARRPPCLEHTPIFSWSYIVFVDFDPSALH